MTNNMKKVFLMVMAVCLAMSAMAVELPKQGFGMQIGWAQPILRLNSKDPSFPKDSLVNTVKLNGFKVGLVYDASYVAGFGSTIGINYTFGANTGSWKSKYAYGYPRSRQMITYHEVEVFVDWQYKFEVAKETYLMLYTGPSIQCGLGLNMRVDEQMDFDAEVVSNRYSTYKTDKKNEALKRLNVTWGVGAGFQYKRYFLRGGYDFGLLNPYKNAQFVDDFGNPIDRNTRGRLDQWSIKIGMYFWYND